MFESLINNQQRLAQKVSVDFKRYLYSQINWKNRLIALLGARGVGKTTLVFQHYLETYGDPSQCLYILGDDLDVLQIGLRKIAREFDAKGGKVLIIDEVHKYPNWSQEVKNIYDLHPDLKLIISGSSNISITREKHDLSRRVVTNHLVGLSFREFINLELGLNLDKYDLEEILQNHLSISQQINKEISDSKFSRILVAFEKYLSYGYYPYYREGLDSFDNRLTNVLDKVFYEDIPVAHEISQSSVIVLKKLMILIGSSHPFTVDITSIANSLNISRNYTYKFINYLLETELLIEGMPTGSGFKAIRKPSKLFLNNPNLYSAIGQLNKTESKIGTIRETFAFNQLSQKHKISVPKKGDILVDDKYVFEIGGESKDFSQIKGIADSYVFADGIEYGYDRKIPLWLLGFLY